MPWWIVASTDKYKKGLMGPYVEGRAREVRDGLDDPYAEVYYTEATKRSAAVQEINQERVERKGVGEGFKNFRHKGVMS